MLSYWASSPELADNHPFFTRTYPSDSTAAMLLVRVLYKLLGWNHVAVVYTDDAWGQGYVTEMKLEFELELERHGYADTLDSTSFTNEDVEKYHTLKSFPFTESGGEEPDDREIKSVKRALDEVRSSGYTVVVVVAFGRSLENLLEAKPPPPPDAPFACAPFSRAPAPFSASAPFSPDTLAPALAPTRRAAPPTCEAESNAHTLYLSRRRRSASTW